MKVSEEDEDESEDDFEVKLEEEPEMESGKNSLKRKPELVSAEEPAKKKKKKRPEKCKVRVFLFDNLFCMVYYGIYVSFKLNCDLSVVYIKLKHSLFPVFLFWSFDLRFRIYLDY